jgi:hypothetical protein
MDKYKLKWICVMGEGLRPGRFPSVVVIPEILGGVFRDVLRVAGCEIASTWARMECIK